jgi:CRISPR-associated endonuclease/helicase Cas3
MDVAESAPCLCYAESIRIAGQGMGAQGWAPISFFDRLEPGMSQSSNRAERLREMEWLYSQRAYSDSELAEYFKVERSTIWRDRLSLADQVALYEESPGRYRIQRSQYLSYIRLNLNEALALYLAARRASRQALLGQPHMANALEKLAQALKQPMTGRLTQAARRLEQLETAPERLRVLEEVTQAWAEQRKLRLSYRALRADQTRQHVVHPYLIEPALWSEGAYLLGHSEQTGKAATFKIERIEQAEMLLARFELPEAFDEQELLRYAWGIWSSEDEPVTVQLRFAPGPAARRVLESRWHPTEQTTRLDDGGVLWQAQVAEWQELLPWVRGWGSDVEALAPRELRERVIRDLHYQMRRYQIEANPDRPSYAWLWAKADRLSGLRHPLIYHLIDVAMVTLAIWQHVLTPTIRKQYSDWLALDQNSGGALLAFWAGLHDLGKASPPFQNKISQAALDLKAAGYDFPDVPLGKGAPHGFISTHVLEKTLVEETGLDKLTAIQIASATGGHHGAWPTAEQIGPTSIHGSDKGGPAWSAARVDLIRTLKGVLNPPDGAGLPADQQQANAFLTLFSGLTSVADWIGSMDVFFPYQEWGDTPAQYAEQSAENAYQALKKLGWLGWQASGETIDFRAMFGFEPRPIQQAVMDAALPIERPALLIIEAPTGIGKTEIALFTADHWVQNEAGRGLYIAMPTMATSNQMFERFVSFLKNRYPEDQLNVHLVHGQARLSKDMKEIEASQVSDDEKDRESGSVNAMTWFLPRKRTLLAPFGVGTVDQALMAVLQTRHFFVRMFGLSHKVVIFDEIHAYDTYMSVLFQRLLGWLRALGTSVILLSATLPETTRQSLAAAYLGRKQVSLPPAAYPRMTCVSETQLVSATLPATASRRVILERIDQSPQAIAARLAIELRDGGCAAVICNRVARATEVFRAIRDAGIVEKEDLLLFHARFPHHWRSEIEAGVLERFGKHSQGLRRSIVVATQVIEQSLDLDFDLMISDLAPIDLLIQRAGRLHRHARPDAARPPALQQARLILADAPLKDDLPDFGRDVYIYAPYILLRTWLALREKNELVLPDETTDLIEGVYGDQVGMDTLAPGIEQALQKVKADMLEQQQEARYLAKTRLTPSSQAEDLLDRANLGLDEDNPAVHQDFRAMTRLIDPGVTLICLHRTNGGIALDPEGSNLVDLDSAPDAALEETLQQRAVAVQHRGVVNGFLAQKPPSAWQRSPALRTCYAVVFENNQYVLQGTNYVLLLNRETGLEIQS